MQASKLPVLREIFCLSPRCRTRHRSSTKPQMDSSMQFWVVMIFLPTPRVSEYFICLPFSVCPLKLYCVLSVQQLYHIVCNGNKSNVKWLTALDTVHVMPSLHWNLTPLIRSNKNGKLRKLRHLHYSLELCAASKKLNSFKRKVAVCFNFAILRFASQTCWFCSFTVSWAELIARLFQLLLLLLLSIIAPYVLVLDNKRRTHERNSRFSVFALLARWCSDWYWIIRLTFHVIFIL